MNINIFKYKIDQSNFSESKNNNYLGTSIMPVLTQRIYLGDAHENNQCSIVHVLTPQLNFKDAHKTTKRR